MDITVNVTGDRQLIADLDRAIMAAPLEVTAIVAKGAVNIKKDWAGRWSGMAHAPRLPAAITYDWIGSGTQIGVEIGPDKSLTQGALGNLIEFGSAHNAPRPGGLPALEAEEPRFETALQELAARLINGG